MGVYFNIILFSGSIAFISCINQQVDLTRTPGTSGPEVVRAVVDIIRRTCIFPDDILYLRRVAYVATNDGQDSSTYAQGLYGGIWQVDKDTFVGTQSNPDLDVYRQAIADKLFINWTSVDWTDLRKPLYSGLAAELAAIEQAGSAGIPNTIETQASFWANGGSRAHDFLVRASQLKLASYSSSVDVAFVLDSSTSLSPADFERTKEFVQKVIEGFDIDGGMVRAAVVEYSSNVYPKFNLSNGLSRQSLTANVAKLTYIPGGTNTKDALEYVRDVVFKPENGARKNSAKVLILVTDGRSDDKSGTATAALALQKDGVNIFTVGVGALADKQELNFVASDPKCVHAKTVSNYTDLPAINYEIQQMSLQSSLILTPGTYTFDCDSNLNVMINAPNTGATVEISVDNGLYSLYGTSSLSFSPSSILYTFNDTVNASLPVQLYLRDNSRVVLALRNSTSGGCNSNIHIKVSDGNLIQLGTQLTCIQSNLLSACFAVDFEKSPFIITGKPEPTLPNVCTGFDSLIVPYPQRDDRFIYCYRSQMVIVYCLKSQVFNPLTERCVAATGRTTPMAVPTSPIYHATSQVYVPVSTAPVVDNPCTPVHIQNGLLLWPYPGDNTKFIKCDNWAYAGVVLTCEPHHYYSQNEQTCLYSEVVVNATVGMFSNLQNPCIKDYKGDVQFHPYPGDTHKYIQCDAFGEAFIKQCLGTEVWSQSFLTCVNSGPLVG